QQSPANAQHLAKSIEDVERGNTIEVDLESYE
ncbi:prevent-host-death protein, partial [Staphylococcus saprophyticus]